MATGLTSTLMNTGRNMPEATTVRRKEPLGQDREAETTSHKVIIPDIQVILEARVMAVEAPGIAMLNLHQRVMPMAMEMVPGNNHYW